MPGKITHNDKPLDFSYLKLQNIDALKKERPRDGHRKPVEKEEDEEDTKKESNNQLIDEAEGEKKEDKTQEVVVVRAQHANAISDILAKNSTSL